MGRDKCSGITYVTRKLAFHNVFYWDLSKDYLIVVVVVIVVVVIAVLFVLDSLLLNQSSLQQSGSFAEFPSCLVNIDIESPSNDNST